MKRTSSGPFNTPPAEDLTTHNHVLVLGTGWRDMPDNERSKEMVRADFRYIEQTYGTIVFVVQGGGRGADTVIDKVAKEWKRPRCTIPASWHLHGKRAGRMRNVDMRNFVDVLAPYVGIVVGLAYPAPESVGTKHMMELIEERNWYLVTHDLAGAS